MDELLKPKEFEIKSFFKGGGICPELISTEGEKNIGELIEYLIEPIQHFDTRRKKKVWINKALSINQVRKFYDSFLKIVNTKQEEEEQKVRLIMHKANAEYSAKRLDTHRFKVFFANRINLVVSKSGEDFKRNLSALKLHLEALVAYYPKNVKE